MTLIHKVDSPSQMRDFQPISFVGSLYKLLAKLLVGRLIDFMEKLISYN